MEVEVLIDQLTDCLVERESGVIVETEFKKREIGIKSKDFKGWKFKWNETETDGYSIYELFIKGEEGVQGRISLKIDGGVADVDIVESAPHNVGHNGKYKGVGGHLFAIACKVSKEADCDGVVAFNSKSNLVEHYKTELNAIEIFPRRMVIPEESAKMLIDKYIRK